VVDTGIEHDWHESGQMMAVSQYQGLPQPAHSPFALPAEILVTIWGVSFIALDSPLARAADGPGAHRSCKMEVVTTCNTQFVEVADGDS